MSKEQPDFASHQTLTTDIKGLVEEAKEKRILQRYYADNPYIVLGASAAAGYLLAGGLFSPFSRRLIRIGMKAVFIPFVLAKVSELSAGE